MALRLDGAVFQSSKFFNVLENLEDRVRNAIDVFLATKEQVMREPDCFVIRGTLRNRALVHLSQIERRGPSPAQSRKVRGIQREQRASVDRLVEKTIARNSLQLECRDEGGARNFFHLFGKIFQHISVGGQIV